MLKHNIAQPYDKKTLFIGKNTVSEYFYYTIYHYYDEVLGMETSKWFQGRRALKDCKEWAKAQGYERILILAKSHRTKDREIIL